MSEPSFVNHRNRTSIPRNSACQADNELVIPYSQYPFSRAFLITQANHEVNEAKSKDRHSGAGPASLFRVVDFEKAVSSRQEFGEGEIERLIVDLRLVSEGLLASLSA